MIATEIEITHGGHTRDESVGGASVVAASKLIVLTRYTYAVQLESNFIGSPADFCSQTIRTLSIQSPGRPDKRNPAPWLVRTTRDAVGR